MAGNALPILLAAGAALFLMKKKGDEKDSGTPLPSLDDGETKPVEEEEIVFDVTADMPRIESLEDQQKWANIFADKAPEWVGTIEYLNADEHLEELGFFVEESLDHHAMVYGRTIDRAELSEDAAGALKAQNPQLENDIAKFFADLTGLEMMVIFVRPKTPQAMAVLFYFDTEANEQAATPVLTEFTQALVNNGVQPKIRAAHRGQENPSAKGALKELMHDLLPLKTSIGGITETIPGTVEPVGQGPLIPGQSNP